MTPYFETELGKLYHGDCLEILPQLEERVDLVLTDPPYFLPVRHYVCTREKGYSKRTLGDTSVLKGYFERFFETTHSVLNITGTYYIFCDGQSYPIFYQAMFPHCKYVRPLIWDKLISYNGYTWRHQHELIAWGELDNSERIPTGDGDVLKCRGVLQKERNHPAEKPVELVEKLILKHKPDVILDPFFGSGTTAIACERLNRRWIGIEISKEYCDIAVDRIKKETAQYKMDMV